MKRLMNEECTHLLTFEKIEQDQVGGKHTYRAAVPGGWLVRIVNSAAHPQTCEHIFIADKEHSWGTTDESPEF